VSRIAFGFLLAALVFAPDKAINFLASVAVVAKQVYVHAEAAGEAAYQGLDKELVKRDVLPPQEERKWRD